MKRIIGIGSKNKAKMAAAEKVLAEEYIIKGFEVDSGVSVQPFSDEETKRGAVHRAESVINSYAVEVGIGLEGGVELMEDGMYLCNWGAIADKEGLVFTASGAKILLPEIVAAELYDGKELKDAMLTYTNRTGVSHSEGAIGVFTGGFVDRADMFSHIVKLLYGQWQYHRLRT